MENSEFTMTEDYGEDNISIESQEDGQEETERPIPTQPSRNTEVERINRGETEEPKEKEGKEDEKGESDQTDEKALNTKEFTKEELGIIAKKYFGAKSDDDYIVDKNGNLKIIMKINGQKRLVSPDDLRKGFNTFQAGQEKLTEGKTLVNQVKQLFAETKSNPNKLWEIADKLGIDKYQLSQELLQKKVEEYNLTPEQREMQDYKRRAEEAEKREQEIRAQQEQVKQQELKNEQIKKYDTELREAMEKHGFKSADKKIKSHILMGAIGKLMLANQHKRDLSSDDAVYLAKKEWQEYVQGYFDEIDDDHIIKVVPDRIVKAIRKADLSRLNKNVTPTSRVNEPIGQTVELPKVNKPKKRMTIEEAFSYENLIN